MVVLSEKALSDTRSCDLVETRCGLKAIVILRLVGRVPGWVSLQLHSPSVQCDNSFYQLLAVSRRILIRLWAALISTN
jgi:hypothetical protein